ncbi:MAG: DUF1844 domain-containing protein [Sedimentisphaerales bacterium]
MAEEKKQEKKIIIDEDWKTKAQKEKEALKAEGKTDKEDKNSEQQQYQLPPGDFGALVSLLATQAMFAMGMITTEKDKEPKKDLRLAKFHIDMLESLEEKTKGNLTDEEQKFLSSTLSQLRMGFVNMAG